MGRVGIPVFGSIPGSAKGGGEKMSRMKKPIKKGRLPGRPRCHRILQVYRNNPAMSIQKNNKIVRQPVFNIHY